MLYGNNFQTVSHDTLVGHEINMTNVASLKNDRKKKSESAVHEIRLRLSSVDVWLCLCESTFWVLL